ncbi:hypothetical protein HOF17_00140 [Candidatus Peribacteria bacterium]|jgi:nanoRNase/pAp phosphatase (c-di-AMP/oligoRNAs hydrolase)|nr:hypothetical protein [Candidatus Peribacteria bacterium]
MITSDIKKPVLNTKKAQVEAKKTIDEATNILIVPHANVDPDGLGSALACYMLFTTLDKKCTVICPDTLPESLSFLPGFNKLEQEIDYKKDFIITLNCANGFEVDKLRYVPEENGVNIIITPKKGDLRESDISLKDGPLPYDLVVVVDTADVKLLGSFYETHKDLFDKVPVLNIDHHISNSKFGTCNLLSTSSASATEVLYEWFMSVGEWKAKITSDIATLLLTGLITDTRSFQNPNTTPRSLEIAAELLDMGARQQEIIQFIYKTKPLSTLKIWGRALNNIQVNKKDHIVWSTISRDDLAEMDATSKETHGIIDDLLTTIPGADVYILFTEIEEGKLKASMRTSEEKDASVIASELFEGGGHNRAAGFRREGYGNFQLEVLDCVKKVISKMQGVNEDFTVKPSDSGSKKKDQKKNEDGSIDIVKGLSE